MYVTALGLVDFRSYQQAEVQLAPGVTAFVGPNGQGKTNLVEAIHYTATLGSHRVANDAPLVRAGAARAIVRTEVRSDQERDLVIELEINPGRANRARVNRAPVPRPRDVLGLLRTVLFAPEDLALVKGDPSERRRFLDELLTLRTPRMAGVRQDYDRILKQRNSLLKSASVARRQNRSGGAVEGQLRTLEVWDSHLARAGSELLATRLELLESLRPLVSGSYDAVARGKGDARLEYKSSVPLEPGVTSREELAEVILSAVHERRSDELDRGVSLVGPHRDDMVLGLGDLPAKGYASHGESWSFALALRLASYELLRSDGGEPVLILDDVFAELDTQRRDRLAELVAPAEQVLVTAAVGADVPAELSGVRFDVGDGTVRRA
ncbi:DNA replication and repair protein RecF [Kribbella orskensis]|uniref:DNA replication and repair protein RecF n=1 Tax=Kribbella orskensis TaxID=2512216 RepID=A0ABY2BPW2_9ACTN|nr:MULTISPECIES: DNA replication/repair protein RecF [Kribbella]TCN39563.1 DNA replication and repair protein RecF [Kribbella sp. VKM Ac-2500]TCO27655.1 DNA replication and repair protein RecF [Kribbella orskensis]